MDKSTRSLKRDEQEQVYHRRLIYDGYGTGEDKKLLNIIKNITQLCLDPKGCSGNIIKDIDIAIQMCERRANLILHYEKEICLAEDSILATKENIGKLRSGLEELILQKHFVDKLKRVTSWPDCRTTNRILDYLEEEKKQLEQEIESRTKLKQEILEYCESLASLIDRHDNIKPDC